MKMLTLFIQRVLLKIKQCACPHTVSEITNTTYQPHIMMDSKYVHVVYTKECENCGKTMLSNGVEIKQNMKI